MGFIISFGVFAVRILNMDRTRMTDAEKSKKANGLAKRQADF